MTTGNPAHPAWLEQVDGRVKAPLTLLIIFTIALLPERAWGAYWLLLSGLWAAALLGGLSLTRLLRRSLLALPFGLAALPLLFTIPGAALFALLPGGGLTVTLPGALRFAALLIKAWLSVQAAALLTLTTPFPQILSALRGLRLPRLLVALIALLGRYVFVLSETAILLLRAREARSSVDPDSPQRPGGSLVWRARVTGGMAGSLLLRSFERAERVYAAMLARGYDGEVRCLPQPALDRPARRVLALGTLFCLLIGLFGWLTSGGGA
jgi:cobalt/nickel transport system permease protein